MVRNFFLPEKSFNFQLSALFIESKEFNNKNDIPFITSAAYNNLINTRDK